MSYYQWIEEKNRRIAKEKEVKARNWRATIATIESEWYDTILDIHTLPTRESRQEQLILDTFNKWLEKHSKQ